MMENNFVNSLIQKRQKNQRASDKLLKVFLIVFIVGNVFFLSSNMYMPPIYRNLTSSKIGETLNMSDYTITFDSWDYEKRKGIFEIMVEVENLSLSKNPNIEFKCRSGENIYKTSVSKVIDNSLYVIKVEKVKRNFTSASLTITTVGSNGEENGKFYTTDKTVGEISKAVTDQEYRIYAAESKIKGYKKQIKKLKEKQKKYSEQINYSVAKIEELEIKKKTQTESEQQVTNQNIYKISEEAEVVREELNEVVLEIEDLKAKVKMQTSVLESLERSK